MRSQESITNFTSNVLAMRMVGNVDLATPENRAALAEPVGYLNRQQLEEWLGIYIYIYCDL
jgi:hypothetical protein